MRDGWQNQAIRKPLQDLGSQPGDSIL